MLKLFWVSMMKILDIRGNLVKIESSKPVSISSLLKISDKDKIYIGQVLYTDITSSSYVIFVKVMTYYDAPFNAANITEISKKAECELLPSSEIVTNIGANADIVLGELAFEKNILTAEKEFFDKKILIAADNDLSSNLIISNYAYQIKNLGYNTLVFDCNGTFDGVKLHAGTDFKLPLNEHAIAFIYNKYFSDITDASKALVSSIFEELKNYASTVPYIPFKAFKSVIDNVFDYSKHLNLYFFKTKLEKLDEANVFANSHDDIMNWVSLNEYGPGTVVIDLSGVNKLFVSEYISLVLNSFKDTDCKLYAFAKLYDNFSDKEFIKEIIESNNVLTSCIVPSNFKYLTALKQNVGSILITGGIKKPDNFDYCKFLLKNLPADKFILTGNVTSPYSFIFQLKEITEVIPQPKAIENIEEETEDAADIVEAEFENILQADDTETNNEVENIASLLHEEIQPVSKEHVSENIDVAENILPPSEEADSVKKIESKYEPIPNIDEQEISQVIEDYNPSVPKNNETENQTLEVATEIENKEINLYNERSKNSDINIKDNSAIEQELLPFGEDIQNGENTESEKVIQSEVDKNIEVVQDEEIEQVENKSEGDTNKDTSSAEEENLELSSNDDDAILLPETEQETEILEIEKEHKGMSVEEIEPVLEEAPVSEMYEPLPPLNDSSEPELEIPELEEIKADDSEYEPLSLSENEEVIEISEDIPELNEVSEGVLSLENNSDYGFALKDKEIPEKAETIETIEQEVETPVEKTPEELLDEEIKRDVDKVYMTPSHNEESDELSEDDLDFIEELVGTDDITVEEEISPQEEIEALPDMVEQHSDLLPEEEQELQPAENDAYKNDNEGVLPQRNTAAPAVPIYTAEIPEDAIVHSDPIQQGDRVMHVKFGVGIVEKIFSYGTKNFCSINFENIGRKVLDPNITELKKV